MVFIEILFGVAKATVMTYHVERAQLWELLRAKSSLREYLENLDDRETMEVLLGREIDMEGMELVDSVVKPSESNGREIEGDGRD